MRLPNSMPKELITGLPMVATVVLDPSERFMDPVEFSLLLVGEERSVGDSSSKHNQFSCPSQQLGMAYQSKAQRPSRVCCLHHVLLLQAHKSKIEGLGPEGL
jgi:hypothetical protein